MKPFTATTTGSSSSRPQGNSLLSSSSSSSSWLWLFLLQVVLVVSLTTAADTTLSTTTTTPLPVRIFDITGINATFRCATGATEFAAGCRLYVPNGTDLSSTDAPLTTCLPWNWRTVAWAPTTVTLSSSSLPPQTLDIVDCGSSSSSGGVDLCLAYCSDECTCTTVTTAETETETTTESCPIRSTPVEAAELITEFPDPQYFPLVPSSSSSSYFCSAREQLLLHQHHSPRQCPFLLQKLQQEQPENETMVCDCDYVFCNGEFQGCGPLNSYTCIGVPTRCVLADYTCLLSSLPLLQLLLPYAEPVDDCQNWQVDSLETCQEVCSTWEDGDGDGDGDAGAVIFAENETLVIGEHDITGSACLCSNNQVFCVSSSNDDSMEDIMFPVTDPNATTDDDANSNNTNTNPTRNNTVAENSSTSGGTAVRARGWFWGIPMMTTTAMVLVVATMINIVVGSSLL
ncbi:hypothetical protein ACA910_002203 [Epithemia clementina (nom. ined.)]